MNEDGQGAVSRSAVAVAGLEFTWLVGLVLFPLLLWHRILSDTIVSFHWSVGYFVGQLAPWFLLLAGIAFLLPVAFSAGLHPESRLYPRARKTYAAWGIVLYLLGSVLMVEVAALWHYAH